MKLRYGFNGIHFRLLLASLTALIVLSAVLGWYIITSQRDEMLAHLHSTGRIAAYQIASNAEYAIFSGNEDLLKTLGYSALDSIPSISGVIFYSNQDKKMVEIGTTGHLPDKFHAGPPFLVDGYWYFYAHIMLNEFSVMDYDEGQPHESKQLGWVLVTLANEILLVKQRDVIYATLTVISLGLLMAVWLSIRMGRGIFRPLEDLTYVVERMEAGDLNLQASEEGPLELRKLAYGINQLATGARESNVRMQREVSRATSQLQVTLIELEEAMEAQDQFLARMSHELRTPLTAIIGFSKLLSAETDTDKRDEHLRVIRSSSTMLLKMIDDILEFSKADQGGFTLENISFELDQWATDLSIVVKKMAEEKGLAFTFDIAPDVPRELCGDPVRLAQIFINLINNAIKFTEHGFVRAEIKCLSVKKQRIELTCSISDSGKGIAEGKIPSLFDPFSQEDTSINRRYGGSGLGLSITKRLVEAMEGDIKIDSQVGKGSEVSFTCTLAKDDGAGLSDAELPPLQKVLSGLTVLVAEDNLFNQKLIAGLLKGYGASCLVANNGLEAIEIAGELYVDVVLMDIHMPIVDGITACEIIMKQGGESPPIIAITADITQAEQQRMVLAGAVSVQFKPIDEIKLINAILSATKDQREISESSEGGLLSSVMPVDDLKAALYDNLDVLEVQLLKNEKTSLRQVIHDLMGLCGLYGMTELRELVLQFKASYGTLDASQNSKKIQKIRRHIEEYFVSKSDPD